MIVLVTGGARSGKSRIAEARALSYGRPATYIATAEAFDDEMRTRIALHRARRGDEWRDHPAPIDLAGALRASDGAGPRLVDCLTMWLNNLIYHGHDVAAARGALAQTLGQMRSPVVLVTNEIGMGIVPIDAATRAFRDAQGLLNQEIAALADHVVLAVAGLPVNVK